MKVKQTLLVLSFIFLSINGFGQNEINIGFSSWYKSPIDVLNEDNTKALKVKIDQVIARNGAGATSAMSAIFVIYPEFIVTSSDVVENGLMPMTIVRAELSLFVVNRADMSNYGSVILPLEGNGSNEQAAIRSMISRVQVTNPQITRMIKNAREKIADYYAAQLPTILAKAKSMYDRNQHNEAIALLSMIPEGIDGYPMIAEQMSLIYMKMQDKFATSIIQEAKSKIALHKYEEALTVLLDIDPTSSYSNQAFAMIEQIKQTINNDQNLAMGIKWKLYEERKEEKQRAQNNAFELKKLQIEASKRAGDNELATQIKKADASGKKALESWFLSNLKE